MISRIKQITLIDGKQLFYPHGSEIRQLWDKIETITYEQLMTKEEYYEVYFDAVQYKII